ncbi:hypothetical protein [Devosia sp. 1566]|uniref:hypothetical protein n=1 Tax=Devosia sp. 1566 TaxID=2499144 RepID=UPI000FD86E8F|nr:hypothetical protein [Devosia sp. 1566]
MPQTNPPAHPYPGTRYQLRHAAANNQIIICRCSLCRRLVRYLATDLVELFGPDRDALQPPFNCSVCGKSDYVTVRLTSALPGDYGHLSIRRPGEVRTIQTWRTVKLGDD